MRLDLAVTRRFGLSRRAAREAVRAGRVDVAGETRDEPGAEIAEDAPLAHHPDRPLQIPERLQPLLVLPQRRVDVLADVAAAA